MEKLSEERLNELFGPPAGTKGKLKLRYGLLSVALLLSLVLNVVLFLSIRSLRSPAPAELKKGVNVSVPTAAMQEEQEKAGVKVSTEIAEKSAVPAVESSENALLKRISKLEERIARLEYEQTRIVDLEHDFRKLRNKIEKK